MITVELIFNLSVLVAVSVLSGFIVSRWKRHTAAGKVLQGLLFGAVALIGMLNPFVFSPGIIFDGRSVVISICTLFFGPVAGCIAVVIALMYRLYVGGGGLLTGVTVILSSYLIGVIFYYSRKKKQKSVNTSELYIFGLLVHIAMVSLIAAFTPDMHFATYKTLIITILFIYPLATVLIGKILKDQDENANLLAELETNERHFRSLITNMNQGLAVHKLIYNDAGEPVDYRFEFINEKYEQITGFRKENVLGKTIREVLPETSERTIQKYCQVAVTGVPFHFESYSRKQKIYFEADIYQPGDNLFAVILSDISARKLAQIEIVSKNKIQEKLLIEKDKLFSIVSHDLRSPMNGIIGLTAMIRDEIDSFSKDHIKEIASSINTSASSIIQLLNGLLEWSKLQRGNITFNPQLIPVNISVKKCVSLFHEIAKVKNITVKNSVHESLIVIADKQMLETVIRNLLTNAIKFTHKWGEVEISAFETGTGAITISIKDDGIGMNPVILNKLFSLSSKVNRKGTEGELSSGLGLILCKELVEKMGGSIRVESKEDSGSIFFVTLTSAGKQD